jgi:hypothetical protein
VRSEKPVISVSFESRPLSKNGLKKYRFGV